MAKADIWFRMYQEHASLNRDPCTYVWRTIHLYRVDTRKDISTFSVFIDLFKPLYAVDHAVFFSSLFDRQESGDKQTGTPIEQSSWKAMMLGNRQPFNFRLGFALKMRSHSLLEIFKYTTLVGELVWVLSWRARFRIIPTDLRFQFFIQRAHFTTKQPSLILVFFQPCRKLLPRRYAFLFNAHRCYLVLLLIGIGRSLAAPRLQCG